MNRFFDFATVVYPFIFISGVVVGNNLGLEIPGVGYGYVITALCGLYLGYKYSQKD